MLSLSLTFPLDSSVELYMCIAKYIFWNMETFPETQALLNVADWSNSKSSNVASWSNGKCWNVADWSNASLKNVADLHRVIIFV